MCIYRVTLSFWKLWFDKLSQKSKDNVALGIFHLTLIFTNMLYTSCLACKNVKHQNVRHLLSQFFFQKSGINLQYHQLSSHHTSEFCKTGVNMANFANSWFSHDYIIEYIPFCSY